MDDSFSVRLDKVFGSLTEATSDLSSLWCLTDAEIEKREWNRDAALREGELVDFDNSKPCPPHIDGFFSKPHQTLDLLQSDLEELSQPADDDVESNVRSCIGLDCTLDYEEEEGEFDKVAVCREQEQQQQPPPGDRLYMRDVSDYGISTNTYHELPATLQDVKRDPRANHLAAKLRLQEDAEAALREGHFSSKFEEFFNFPPDSTVPDYIMNPSKYTCYTLDTSDDMDEESNRKAYTDFFSLTKKRAQLEEDESSTTFEMSPTFKPRMKQQQLLDGRLTKQRVHAEQMQVIKAAPLSIATVESDNAQVSAMEENESYVAADRLMPGSIQKPGRHYRTTRANMDIDDHNA